MFAQQWNMASPVFVERGSCARQLRPTLRDLAKAPLICVKESNGTPRVTASGVLRRWPRWPFPLREHRGNIVLERNALLPPLLEHFVERRLMSRCGSYDD